MRTLEIFHLGRVEYADGLALMRLAGERVVAATPPDTDYAFLLEHPPVLTLGRGAERTNVLASPAWLEKQGFEIHQTNRGGDVTYHGPGQVVGYPIVDLNAQRSVRRYVSDLEETMIRTCADYGIQAGRHSEHRGAWVGTRKIGAVGVHISRWISSHGFAFNVAPDMNHFSAIVPCGIADPRLGVTSLSAEVQALGRKPPAFTEVQERLATHLAETLGRRRIDGTFGLRTVSVVPVGADGRVLLLKRTEARGGFWQPVTGRLEPGESPAQAARRELLEEIGADVEVMALGYEHDFGLDPAVLQQRRSSRMVTARESAFLARLPASFACRLSGEHVEQGWFSPQEAIVRVPYTGLKKAIRLATAVPC